MSYRENAYSPTEECCDGCDHPAHGLDWCPKCERDSGCNAARGRRIQIDSVLGGLLLWVVLALIEGAIILPWHELLARCVWTLLAIGALCAAVLAGVSALRVLGTLWVAGGPVARAIRESERSVLRHRRARSSLRLAQDERSCVRVQPDEARDAGGSAVEVEIGGQGQGQGQRQGQRI